jgi:CRP-like cAMP-binding protein
VIRERLRPASRGGSIEIIHARDVSQGISLGTVMEFNPQALLASHPLFGALDARERSHMLSYAVMKRFAPGDLIFRKGDPGSEMSVIATGRIKICVGAESGKEAVLAILGPGEVLGEMAMLDGKERSADAVALSPSALLCLKRRDFLDAIRRHPEIAIGLLAALSERLRRTSMAVEDRYLLHFSARLAKVLLNLVALGDKPVLPGMRVDLPMSQKALASMVGASRETLNRQLHEWQEAGLVSTGKGYVILQDPDALQRIVDT